MSKNTKARDARKDAALHHLAQTKSKYQKEILASITSIKRYSDKKMDNYGNAYIPRFDKTDIIVEATDSVSALFDIDAPRAVLNFASYHNPGGGYENGAWAQEEALCSESTMWHVLDSMRDSFYRPHTKTHNRGLYTSDALFLQDIQFMRDGNVINSDVIVVAAPNAGVAEKNNVSDDDIVEAMEKRIYTVMNIAADNKIENLVLGAFGCGVFANNPWDVADIFKEWLDDNPGIFKSVVFAIPPGGDNLNAFKEVFE